MSDSSKRDADRYNQELKHLLTETSLKAQDAEQDRELIAVLSEAINLGIDVEKSIKQAKAAYGRLKKMGVTRKKQMIDLGFLSAEHAVVNRLRVDIAKKKPAVDKPASTD